MTIRESNADKTGYVPGSSQPGSLGVTAGGAGAAGNSADANAGGAGMHGAAGSTRGAMQAFRWLIKQMGLSTLFFLAIFAVVMVVINLMLTHVDVLDANALLPYSEVLPNSTAGYMLVMGIVMPLYLEILLGQGATRRQFAVGLLGASALIASALALVNVMIALVLADVTVLSVLGWALGNWFYFLVGWLIVIGYQYRHVITAILSTLIGICLLSLWPLGGTFISKSLTELAVTLFGPMPVLLATAASSATTLVLAFVVVILSRRISIKV
ncbi:MAG: hypothetical protein LBU48_06160 [Coriobacteriales bacterium]|jgi:hypothetical protein|nr:hypothetical protein [Coriobacteriales bacterium]